MLTPVCVKNTLQTKHKLCCYLGISVRCSCAHGIAGPEPTSFVNSARGVRQFGFWGAFTRLPTSTTTTTTSPDSLQRLRCYDDDMADPSNSSIAATGYLSLSPLFIYLFFFLPIIQYACLDALQSSFKYACLKCVTFKLLICVYVIIIQIISGFKKNFTAAHMHTTRRGGPYIASRLPPEGSDPVIDLSYS
jgi:hypothetical protein